jgi:hypothetical protein
MIHQVFSSGILSIGLEKAGNRFGMNAVATSTSYFKDYIYTLPDP